MLRVFHSPEQISQWYWAPPCWRVWLESRSGPCDWGGCGWFVEASAAYWGDLSPTTVTTELKSNYCCTTLFYRCSLNMRSGDKPLPCKWPGWGWCPRKLREDSGTPRWPRRSSLACRSAFCTESWHERGWRAWRSSPQGRPAREKGISCTKCHFFTFQASSEVSWLKLTLSAVIFYDITVMWFI